MIINLNLDSAAQAAPTAIKNAWTTAANMIASWFTDNITINLNVTYTGTGGGAAAGPSSGVFVSYQTVYNYLTTHASPGDTTFASLPNATSISGQSWTAVWHAQERLSGLVPANDASID